ncbi:DUF362 domain-containing protein [Desulfatirhabdium butyrativorans]|uniref:DUF362 domain-containing protein n=1 Tax=Desulfatirhabdium butyrativorans TaxID=340467 RepID=UPI0003FC13EA|nr:DUF362 domain-containing protein [Desulfatirhabdium butyrativorans]
MPLNEPISRRQMLFRLGGLAAASPLSALLQTAWAGSPNMLVDASGPETNCDIGRLTEKLIAAAGGMGRYVAKGDVVVIKPNVSWARAPQYGATTHPEVVRAVVRMCFDAGAKTVRIADHTIHDARQCFIVTGIGQIARETGAELVFPASSLMREMNLHGHRLDMWPVFTPIVEADKRINIPVAKVHSISRLTLGMKNWIGGVGGRRNALHQDIHQSITDLAHFFKPDLTIIDATRIMIENGPSGGNLSDVLIKNRLILSDDPVAADAYAASQLFQIVPQEIGYIRLAEKWGMGTTDLTRLTLQKVTL